MSTGAWVLVVAVVIAGALGGMRMLTNGRFRTASSRGTTSSVEPVETTTAPSVLEGTPWVDQAGERATLLQFSSAFCAPCRATRQTLGSVAERTPGVSHVEVDAEQHLDVVRRLGIMRTPTTVVLDRNGHEVTRAAGAPTRVQVEAALASIA